VGAFQGEKGIEAIETCRVLKIEGAGERIEEAAAKRGQEWLSWRDAVSRIRRSERKGRGPQRPLGIAALEDKVVQAAVVALLTPVYEAEFLGFSYGFRPGRGQHEALDALAYLHFLPIGGKWRLPPTCF
jgi:retron-type reverse transcriptase